MPTNYVLVDFENVQPDSLAALAGGDFKVKVFVGAAQAKGRISFELSHSMQTLGSNAEYVRIARSGPNAVDMHIAYYIGRLLEQEPGAVIYIISRDTDFDPLIEFLRDRGVTCHRVRSIADIVKQPPKPAAARAPGRAKATAARTAAPRTASPKPAPARAASGRPAAPKAAPPPPPKSLAADNLEPLLKHLRGLNGKPATRRKLAQTIANYFRRGHGGALADAEVEARIDALVQRGYVTLNGNKVAYPGI